MPYAKWWSHYPGERINPEDTPVVTRRWPGYEEHGIRAGSWMYYPSVSVGALYDSNVFATQSDHKADIAAVENPTLRVESLSERNPVTIDAYVKARQYSHYSSLDQTDASIRAKGRVDVTHDSGFLYTFQAAYLHEAIGSLSSPLGAAEPTPYAYTHENVTYWKQFNRLTVSVGLRNDNYDFGSTRAQNGTTINQDSRDGSIYAAHTRVDYAYNANLGFFTAFEGNLRDLKGTPTGSLSSHGYRSLTGVNFSLTRLIGGEIGAGYTSQRFDDPTIGTVSGPAFRAQLTWSPLRTVDVKLKAEEIATEAVETVASGVRAQSVMLGLDYEFRRNVVLSTFAGYENDKFFGQDRRDDVYSATASLQYLLNRYGTVALNYKYVNRNSSLPSAVYDKHEIGIDVTAHF
ncbi:MAG: outer membrane beta-barrel protein [Pseudolabrys sp.]